MAAHLRNEPGYGTGCADELIRSPGGRDTRVIDTDVLSFIFRGDTRASSYAPHLFGHVLTISFQTRAEVLRGAISAGWGERRRELDRRPGRYAVVRSTDELCLRRAEALAGARRAGRPVAAADAWVAATALLLGVPLVTHNAGDFVGVPGLTVISES